MKRRGLLAVSLCAFLVTGFGFVQAGRFAPESPAERPTALAQPPDPVKAGIAWRMRHTQPHHWRACLLQR